ncbi:DUF1003 domain-containing protein [Sphingomonas solaris]|uniref:DUF1003 domain-containing protein n=1 Tax=Alterirhizorhabdus solaris TaxID=2529389 RepID=A0A558RBU8_9SPHN|nr:DUF1003 domain-containing protein [Sphingomonas solaris]TVV76830.1 DUF1003 domain-containing protein [Sphingomonas solaris]
MTRRTAPELARDYLGKDAAGLAAEERRVLDGIAGRQPIARDMGEEAEIRSTFWDRLADRVAAIGGSWAFIFSFLGILVGWMLLNTGVLPRLHDAAFDPYPYIFLNLMLSMIAALQAPVIMMSQNRQATQDRLAAAHDYEVNLRAELEIMRLHEKVDALRIEHLEALARHQQEVIALLGK